MGVTGDAISVVWPSGYSDYVPRKSPCGCWSFGLLRDCCGLCDLVSRRFGFFRSAFWGCSSLRGARLPEGKARNGHLSIACAVGCRGKPWKRAHLPEGAGASYQEALL